MCTIISSVNSDILTSSFPICIPLISFHCLIALAGTPSTILNKYRENSGISLSFSPYNLMLPIGLLYNVFLIFRYVLCITDPFKTFNTSGIGFHQMLFQHLMRWSCFVLFFFPVILFVWWIMLVNILYIELPLYLWDAAYLVMWYDVLDLVCKYCIEYFYISIQGEDCSQIIFICWDFV